jgi:hypothetical protein
MTRLAILCVTRAEDFALPFLHTLAGDARDLYAQVVIAADGDAAAERVKSAFIPYARIYRVASAGYIESVLDEAVGYCTGQYILRLDDDERLSPALLTWLENEHYLAADHWAFPRANLWGDEGSVLVNPPLWPDAGTAAHFRPFMVPEVAYERVGLRLAPLGDGDAAAISEATRRVLAVTR